MKAIIALMLGLTLPATHRLWTWLSEPDMKQSAQAYCAVHYASVGTPANSKRLCSLWGYR